MIKHYCPRGASARKMANQSASKAVEAGEQIEIGKDGKKYVNFPGSKYGAANRWYHVILD